jgi:hypothetical protein
VSRVLSRWRTTPRLTSSFARPTTASKFGRAEVAQRPLVGAVARSTATWVAEEMPFAGDALHGRLGSWGVDDDHLAAGLEQRRGPDEITACRRSARLRR